MTLSAVTLLTLLCFGVDSASAGKFVSGCNEHKKLSYRRGTARRAMSVEILSTDVQLYEKSHLKRLRPTKGK